MSDEQLIKTPGVFGENGNFLLERELGSGGMGGVYMGRDKMLDRPVAVKVMLKQYGSDEAFVERFKKEAQSAARLIHPNIAQVYSYGISDGMPYIAMELVAGGSLDGLMKVHGNNIDVPRVMKICEQVAQALRCAADQGLVHGDVKPENVLLDANGNAKLVDFGLSAMQNNTDEIWGTPYYIAPEKVKKEPVDYRADMYSLGGTIYHALTGVAPFEGADATEVVRKRFEGAPKKPSEIRPGLSPQIDALVMKMLALDPKDRYPSFEALLEDFKKVMTSGLTATPAPAAAAEAAPTSATRTTTNGKRVVFKTKKFKVAHSEEKTGDESASDEAENGGKKTIKAKGLKMKLSNGEEGESSEEPEEEGGGKLGLKVLLVVLGVLLLIGAVVGGLWAMSYYNEKSNQAKAEQKVRTESKRLSENFVTLKDSISDYEKRFNDKMTSTDAAFNGMMLALSDKLTKDGLFPEDYIKGLPLEKTSELIKAERLLLPPKAAAEEEEPPKAEEPQAESEEKNDEPPPDPADAAEASSEAEPAEPAQAEAAETGAEAANDGPDAEATVGAPIKEEIKTIWEDLCAVKAAGIGVSLKIKKLKESVSAAEAELASAANLDVVKTVNGTWEKLNAELTAIKNSPDAKTADTGNNIAFECNKLIATCGERVNNLQNELAQRREELESKQRAEAEAAQREAEAKAAREKEVSEVQSRASSLESRVMNLDWTYVQNELAQMKSKMKTEDGIKESEFNLKRINALASFQTLLMRKMKGFTFKKSQTKDRSIKDWTVDKADKDRITIKDKNGKTKVIPWTRFYHDYPENVLELFKAYIRDPKVSLGKTERATAMVGYALTLREICKADTTEEMQKFASKIAKEGVKLNCTEAFKAFAEKLFPDIDFSEIAAQAQEDEL